jgi:BTB/POZ domain-containing protein KCTD9
LINILKFKRNNEKLNKNILGITIGEKIIESFILSEKNQIKELFSLCEFQFSKKWNLIYRSSRDSFVASSFHSKCDNKPNTLIIIKSTNGNVFGGYTEQSWNQTYFIESDRNSFLFSLINQLNKPIKMKWSRSFGICCNSNHGPIFGVNDLYIADKSNQNTSSYSDLGASFNHPDYTYGSDEAKSFLAGSYNFQISEIEVFTKE